MKANMRAYALQRVKFDGPSANDQNSSRYQEDFQACEI